MENIANFSRPVKQGAEPINDHDQSWNSYDVGSNAGPVSADMPDADELAEMVGEAGEAPSAGGVSAEMPNEAVGMTPEDFCRLVLPMENTAQIYAHDAGRIVPGKPTKPTNATACLSIVGLVAETAQIDARTDREIWFSPASYSRAGFERPRSAGQGVKAGETGGRKAHNVAQLKTLRWDIDVEASGVKNGKPCHKDRDVALKSFLRILADMGLRPSVIVSSGNGYHVYVALESALAPDRWVKLAKRFEAAILAADKLLGCDTKRWTDPNGLLRMPGARNKKDPSKPKLVEIVGGTGEAVPNSVVSDAVPMLGESATAGGSLHAKARREDTEPITEKVGPNGSLVTLPNGWRVAYSGGLEVKRWRLREDGQRETVWPGGRTEVQPFTGSAAKLGGGDRDPDGWADVTQAELIGMLKRIPPTTGDVAKIIMCIKAWGLAHDDPERAAAIGRAWYSPMKPGEPEEAAKGRFRSTAVAARMTVGTLHYHAQKGDEAAEVDPAADDMRKRVAEALDDAARDVPEIAKVAADEAIERARAAAAETFASFCAKHENVIPLDAIDRAVALANREWQVGTAGANARVYVRRTNPGLIQTAGTGGRVLSRRFPCDEWVDHKTEDFALATSAIRAEKMTPTGIKLVPFSVTWLAHPQHRVAQHVEFRPGAIAEPGVLNLWTRWPVKPAAGDWSRLKAHLLDNVCSGDRGHFDWLLAWCAQMLQQPTVKPGTMVVLRGRKGSGKSLPMKWLRHAVGPYGAVFSNMDQLTGRFTEHLERLVFAGLEEGLWGGDRTKDGPLKTLITEGEHAVEGKGKTLRNNVPVYARLMIASNERWVVPATSEERRYFVLDVSDAKRGDHGYFAAIDDQMLHGGLEAMVHELMATDIRRVNLRKPPETSALREQIMQGLEPTAKWWLDVLAAGEVRDSIGAGVAVDEVGATDAPKDRLLASARASEHFRRGSPPSDMALGRWMASNVPLAASMRVGKDRRWVYRLPPLPRLREDAVERWKLPADIWPASGEGGGEGAGDTE
jgi:hypothetical protein